MTCKLTRNAVRADVTQCPGSGARATSRRASARETRAVGKALRSTVRLVGLLCLLFASVAEAQVQDLGHRLPGGVGLDAGTQPAEGIYVGDRIVWFSSDHVNDGRGNALPLEDFELDAFANVVGVSGTFELGGIYVGAAAAAPAVRTSLSADVPQASLDRFGLGDVFVAPLQLGLRTTRGDLVASYAFYAPTRQAERMGVGRPEWSHQVSMGSTLFFDDARGWRIYALASFRHNLPKLDVDITRGDTFSVQGGIGGRVWRVLDLGIAGYALWQVTDDTGADLPEPLRGTRERVFGLGPEIDLAIPRLRSRLTARYAWDIGAQVRPVGTMLVVGLSIVLWRPDAARESRMRGR